MSSHTPLQVVGITTATAVAAGSDEACALLASGKVECWGSNHSGGLGDGLAEPWSYTPVEVHSIGNATAITAGEYHTCAALSTGRMECWGDNTNGQLGDRSEAEHNIPVSVAGVTGIG